MSDIFNEVDEELRRDQVENLFRRYLPHMIAVAVFIVAGVAGREAWNWYQVQRDTREANTYAAANQLLKDGKNNAALKAFEQISRSGPKGYALIARLQAADAAMRAGNQALALDYYHQAAQATEDPLFRDLAIIKSVMIQFSSMDFEEMESDLNDAIQPGRPYRALARELIASKALAVGKKERARSEYKSLEQALDTSSGVLQRAQIALSLLGPEPAANKTQDASKMPQKSDTTKTNEKTDAEASVPNEDNQ